MKFRWRWKHTAWAILGAFALCAAGSILFPVSTGHSAPNAICIEHLRQLGYWASVYVVDYDDRLPSTEWSVAMDAYIKNSDLETCPLVRRTERKNGYAMNLGAAGRPISKLEPRTVLFFETDALGRGVIANLAARNRTRHKGSSFVAYVDGTARKVLEGEEP